MKHLFGFGPARRAVLLGLVAVTGCTTAIKGPPTLKGAFKNDFRIGVAVNQRQFYGEDPRGNPIIQQQYDSISPENVLKWEIVHPQLGTYNFDAPDQYVRFGETNHIYIVGHTLVWHSQTPRWVFRNPNGQPLTRDELLDRMHDHIKTVVGRYKGRIQVWDVVNEALNEDGSLRKSAWMRIIGPDYIEKAFQWAHEADPDAILRYNDFSLENEPKRKGAIALLKKLQSEGIPVSAVGLQGHCNLSFPTRKQEDSMIRDFAKLHLQVMVTELDVDCSRGGQRSTSADVAANAQAQREASPAPGFLSDNLQRQLAKRYSDLFGVFVKHKDVVSLVTFWGVTDADSWRARGNPLLFDRHGEPKPAFDAVLHAAGR
jgi:endo-1,4-beta-xylanase